MKQDLAAVIKNICFEPLSLGMMWLLSKGGEGGNKRFALRAPFPAEGGEMWQGVAQVLMSWTEEERQWVWTKQRQRAVKDSFSQSILVFFFCCRSSSSSQDPAQLLNAADELFHFHSKRVGGSHFTTDTVHDATPLYYILSCDVLTQECKTAR